MNSVTRNAVILSALTWIGIVAGTMFAWRRFAPNTNILEFVGIVGSLMAFFAFVGLGGSNLSYYRVQNGKWSYLGDGTGDPSVWAWISIGYAVAVLIIFKSFFSTRHDGFQWMGIPPFVILTTSISWKVGSAIANRFNDRNA